MELASELHTQIIVEHVWLIVQCDDELAQQIASFEPCGQSYAAGCSIRLGQLLTEDGSARLGQIDVGIIIVQLECT